MHELPVFFMEATVYGSICTKHYVPLHQPPTPLSYAVSTVGSSSPCHKITSIVSVLEPTLIMGPPIAVLLCNYHRPYYPQYPSVLCTPSFAGQYPVCCGPCPCILQVWV
jgi:hypothetical protein